MRAELRKTPFLALTWKHALVVGASLVVVVAVFDIAMPSNPLRLWYCMTFLAPPQEARYRESGVSASFYGIALGGGRLDRRL